MAPLIGTGIRPGGGSVVTSTRAPNVVDNRRSQGVASSSFLYAFRSRSPTPGGSLYALPSPGPRSHSTLGHARPRARRPAGWPGEASDAHPARQSDLWN